MKHLLLCLLLLIGMAAPACKKDSEPAPVAASATNDKVTGDNYALLLIGMSYAQVVVIMGPPSTSDTATGTYTWSADNTNTIVISVLFVNGVLASKAGAGIYIPPASGNSNACPATYNGRTVYTGPKGGCYYINGSGNKTYI